MSITTWWSVQLWMESMLWITNWIKENSILILKVMKKVENIMMVAKRPMSSVESKEILNPQGLEDKKKVRPIEELEKFAVNRNMTRKTLKVERIRPNRSKLRLLPFWRKISTFFHECILTQFASIPKSCVIDWTSILSKSSSNKRRDRWIWRSTKFWRRKVTKSSI